jgi:hypothetical protein
MIAYPSLDMDKDHVLFVANRISQSSSHDWPKIFEGLRRRGHLSATVHGLNRLLDDPAHRDLAQTALKRFGLEHGG